MACAAPFSHTAGPHNAQVVAIGEAWGEKESVLGVPFVGESGKELFRMLAEGWSVDYALEREMLSAMLGGDAWIGLRDRWLAKAGILLTNTFAFRPQDNKLETLCSKRDVVGKDYDLPPIKQGHYIRPEFLPELGRLQAEIAAVKPKLLVAFGNTAIWAVLQSTRIGAIRGTVALSVAPRGVKTIATYHPAGVLRNWAWRPIVVTDLMKARRESIFPDIRRPSRRILVNPSIEEVEQWTRGVLAKPPALMASDIETVAGQISMISFAPSRDAAIVIPFVDSAQSDGSYWRSATEETRAWASVKALLEAPEVPKLFQNGLFDLQFLARMGFRPQACRHDTMLLSHSLYPEMPKGLGFLGSIYTNEPAWKLMRHDETLKRDE